MVFTKQEAALMLLLAEQRLTTLNDILSLEEDVRAYRKRCGDTEEEIESRIAGYKREKTACETIITKLEGMINQ